MVHVAYFSHSGNTRTVAEAIGRRVGAMPVRIEPRHAYPEGYEAVVEQARRELQAKARPEVVATGLVSAPGDLLFVGFPNWWATMPMPVFTFLEGLSLEGTTLLPFCTHEGSGMGRSVQDLRRLCAGADVVEGLAIRGGRAHGCGAEVAAWLERLAVPTAGERVPAGRGLRG